MLFDEAIFAIFAALGIFARNLLKPGLIRLVGLKTGGAGQMMIASAASGCGLCGLCELGEKSSLNGRVSEFTSKRSHKDHKDHKGGSAASCRLHPSAHVVVHPFNPSWLPRPPSWVDVKLFFWIA
jgi:hypothetical protein